MGKQPNWSAGDNSFALERLSEELEALTNDAFLALPEERAAAYDALETWLYALPGVTDDFTAQLQIIGFLKDITISDGADVDLDDDNSVADWFEIRRDAYRAMQYWVAQWCGFRG